MLAKEPLSRRPTVESSTVAAVVVVAAAQIIFATGCRQEGCVGGDDGRCVPASACTRLTYACGTGSGLVRVSRVASTADRSPGAKALGARGDFVLENDRLRAVLDAPEHPQGLAPSGGSIIDLAPTGTADELNGIFQGAGLLPRDAVHYQTAEVIDDATRPETPLVAVIFRGHLEGDPAVTVVTRYELRPCEPGLRVRTELYNGASDPNTFSLTDGYFWGDRTLVPFVPLPGQGFTHPELDLLALSGAWRSWPFMAARPQAGGGAAYAVVSCSAERGEGFNESTLSASGVALRPTLPQDGLVYERFIITAPGPGLAPVAGEALAAHGMLQGRPAPVAVVGRAVSDGAPFDGRDGRAAAFVAFEPGTGERADEPAVRTPWSEAVPGSDGSFRLMLPPDRSYKLQTYAFGRPVGDVIPFTVGRSQVDLGDVSVARPARLVVTVNQSPGVPGDFADVVLVPAGGPGSGGGAGTLYGLFGACEPMLGPQHGASPACNRAVTFGDGRADLLVPPGRYFVYAHRGPFAAIARQEVTLAAGDDVALTLTAPDLPGLVPAGVLSGDFHVHGGASYDTIIPDRDRVASFLAHAVDVVIATDHDVVADYAETLAALGSVATGRLVVVAGVEATPNLLWFMVPGESFPKTLGHFNFWPLRHDPLEPRGGAPWDELLEPGGLMDAVEPLFATGGAAGVRQMNHPWSDAKLGRDQGFLRVLGYDPRIPIRPGASYAADILLRAPGGGHRNIDWDVQEVMTGADRGQWLSYREIWFSLLSQGIRKAGAANSDTHSLHADQVGCPRNLVFTGQALAGFDLDRFDADVRAGRMVGTTGPVLDAYVADASGGGVPVRPSLGDVTPGPGAELVVEVRAAPFIPVEEVRVFVNGQQVRTASVRSELGGLDPFGERIGSAVVRMPLADLVAGFGGDVWLVVEAGMPQPAYAVDPETGLPELSEPVVPASPESPLYHIEVVAPGVLPLAFTNPFFLDLDGGGWTAPGLPQESGR